MTQNEAKNSLEAGTGFMLDPREALSTLQKRGYVENIVPKFDHFEVRSGEVEIFPRDFEVDEVIRFENTSDPDDQAILYAISSEKNNIKGVFMESYGLYHEDLSPAMIERLGRH